MKAEVTREFKGKGDHDTSERYFAAGEIIHGELAKAAVKDGNAKLSGATPTAAKPAPKKAKAKR